MSMKKTQTPVTLRALSLVMAAEDEDWRDYALCPEIGPGPFFPQKGENTARARAICADCPVRPECLDYALAVEATLPQAEWHGIFGGTVPGERRAIQERRRSAA